MRPLRFCVKIGFVFHLIISIIELIHGLVIFNGDFLTQYGPFFLMTCQVNYSHVDNSNFFFILQGQAAVIILFNSDKKTIQIMNETFLKMWDYETFHPKIAKLVKQKARTIMFFVFLNDTLALIALVLYWPITGQNDDIYYAISLFNKVPIEKISYFLKISYYFTLPFGAYLGISLCHFIVYLIMHWTFQTYITNTLFENIDTEYRHFDDVNLIHDQNYQQKVATRLKVCIRHHQLSKT